MKRWKINIEIEKIDDGYVLTQTTHVSDQRIASELKGENYKITAPTPSEALSQLTTRLTAHATELNQLE